MWKIKNKIMLGLLFLSSFCILSRMYAVAQVATINGQVSPIPDMVVTIPVNVISDSLPYQTGGVIFNFPAGTFTLTPTARVTLQWPTYATTFVHCAYVTSISTTSATVQVNKINSLGVITEADPNEVNVAILVSGL